MNARLVVFPRGQLDSKSKERLTKMGIAWVEADDPTSVIEVSRTAPLAQTVLTGDGVVIAAVAALANCSTYGPCDAFVKNLHRALLASQSRPAASGLQPERAVE